MFAESIEVVWNGSSFFRLGLYSTDVDQYQEWECQGEGSFAKVYRATKKNDDGYIALKELKRPISVENATDFLIEEQNLRWVVCVTCYCWCIFKGYMEYK